MKNKKVIIGIVIAVAVVLVWGVATYNRMVGSDEAVQSAWAQVENVYKSRADLVPQLVATVQGAADYERSVLTEITNARTGADQATVNPAELSEEQLRSYQQAQDRLSKAIGATIKLTVENYPDITATQGFRDLQVQLEGTENRITVERNKFNEVVRTYNASIRRFPANVVAAIGGFRQKAYFSAPEGSEEPVKVEFNF